MRIFDTSIFNVELDLLEIRLEVLDAVVDVFVVVEASHTFTGKPKSMILKDNFERFSRWAHKLRYIPLMWSEQTFQQMKSPWEIEADQRNAIVYGLRDAAPDDLIVISDADEIVDPTALLRAARFSADDHTILFQQAFFYYWLNCRNDSVDWYLGPKATRFKNFQGGQHLRGDHYSHVEELGGWHFSYLGGVEAIQRKIEAFSHTEYNTEFFKDPNRLTAAIEQGKDLFERDYNYRFVHIDDFFPLYIRANKDRYAHLIKEL